MIVTLEDTTSAAVGNRLVSLREEGGAVALGRVLTLVILAEDEASAEDAIHISNVASHEHPARVIVVLPDGAAEDKSGLDAEIRVGSDAGASEVVVLRPHGGAGSRPDTLVMPLLLPDTPIVAWWTGMPPAAPSKEPIGLMAQRRITNTTRCADPGAVLATLAENYAPGDSDLAWAGVTMWRSILAATLDEPPFEPITAAAVSGSASHPSIALLAGWLAMRLGVPVTMNGDGHDAISGVVLERESGPINLTRPQNSTIALLSRPGRPDQRLNLPKREIQNSLIEELRRLDPDTTYGQVLTEGLVLLELD
ncbi:glucose-6-phosphate dehydrogenase assembly protein OpcA [Georgenia sp. SYP-B2076]|uniref:glucose-6-phosphate dehydrogenase assembly protein OpcA n=1 Tax=Georgenia sp. SYP-B2076 TaxID=2495881 RepID=UPI000F8C90EB|nr:glucose-6-phosphate dehydrogenase assembly protein OpcA [Georgenia sp. SYP-B2076]